jgi:hypothetical protein
MEERLDLVSEKLENLLKESKDGHFLPTVMVTTDCNETFASENQKTSVETDYLRTFHQLQRGISQRNLVNIDLVTEILESPKFRQRPLFLERENS